MKYAHIRALLLLASLAVAPLGGAALAGDASSALAGLTGDKLYQRADVGVHVVDAGTGAPVFTHGDDPMVPASTAKLITAAAALKTLGPDWRFSTTLAGDRGPGGDGVLAGNLYVIGGGDPSLVVEKLWKLVYDLKLAGVTRVSGDVIFDDSYMDAEHTIHGWDKAHDVKRGPTYFAPVGALSLNFNAAAIVVGPGEAPGEPARAALETPAQKVVTLENKATTGRAGSRASLVLDRKVSGDRVTFVISGSIPTGSEAGTYYKTVSDPTSYFTAVFAEMMKLHGITVGGHYLEGEAPEDAKTLIQLKSPPLATILLEMNKSSSNFYAEQVFKAMGAEVRGGQGTAASGASVVDDYLEGLGIPADAHISGLNVVNGSGLSTDWQVRPSHLTAVLVDMARDQEVGAEFVASLAIGGRDGTLRKRYKDEDYDLRVRGKTGSLAGVSCLSGYVDGGDGRRYAFALLANALPGSSAEAKAAQDRLVETLLTLPPPDMGDPSIRVAEGTP